MFLLGLGLLTLSAKAQEPSPPPPLFFLRIFICLLCTCNVSLHCIHKKSSKYYIHLISSTVHIFFFSVFYLYFFFLLNIYKNPHIYFYTDTKNLTIFLQLLRCQFFISQNKLIKYETMINYNWIFCENVMTLVG